MQSSKKRAGKTMKLLLLAVVAALAFYIYFQKNAPVATASHPKPETSLRTAEKTPAGASPLDEAPMPSDVELEDLLIVRGRVVNVLPEGLLIYSTRENHSHLTRDLVTATTGGAGIAAAAQLAIEHETKNYGQLMNHEGPRGMQPARIKPKETAEGPVLLVRHPEQNRFVDDDTLKVVAAPTGKVFSYPAVAGTQKTVRVYSVQYVPSEKAKNAWMWEGHRSKLTR
jgi:hypothetical protein